MRKASQLNDKAVERLQKEITADLTEKQLVTVLKGIYEDLGADGLSFDPIIGFAANGANPHGEPGDRYEKELMRKASQLNDKAVERLQKEITADLTEKQLVTVLKGI